MIIVDSKQKYGIIIAVIGIFAAAAGGSFALDFSTNIGQIGDNIINNYLADQGINLDEFRAMCDRGDVDEQFVQYCGLI